MQTGTVDMDTMLYEQDILQRHVTLEDVAETVPEELTFLPGEGQKPISVFEDTDSEYMAFPTIFCGQWRVDNKDQYIPVHYSDICKYELQSVDRRAAANIPHVFSC